MSSTDILLMWYKPMLPYGVIVTYTISYNKTASDTVVVTLNSSVLNYYVAENLNEYTFYTFSVFASTRIGGGPSDSITDRTLEDCKRQCCQLPTTFKRATIIITRLVANYNQLLYSQIQLLHLWM